MPQVLGNPLVVHKFYKVIPDMAMYGKALGNGYAITAVVGKRSIMENASTNFISSTMWTERIGTSAAIECLNVMEKTKSWLKITETGKWLKNQWRALAKLHNLKIDVMGLDATQILFLIHIIIMLIKL